MQVVDLNQGFLLIIPAGSPLAVSARLSLGSALGEICKAIEDYRRRNCNFEEWRQLALTLAETPEREEAAALYRSYSIFCEVAGVPLSERLTMTTFGRMLTKLGISRAKAGNGRILRVGCRLKPLSDFLFFDHRQLQTDRQLSPSDGQIGLDLGCPAPSSRRSKRR